MSKKISADELYNLAELDGGKFSVDSLDAAFDFCKKISIEHYENFPVGSILVPHHIRKHFYSIYAFSRIADDIGDELIKTSTSEYTLIILNKYKTSLEKIHSDKILEIHNPIFLALKETINKFDIPIAPFLQLISAFESDILFKKFQNFDELLVYCDNSANPIGELVLRLFGEYNENNLKYSNSICSALQLINFWQDISIDTKNNRVYIPQELLFGGKTRSEISEALVEYTKELMRNGENLLKKLYNFRLKLELAAIISGGNLLLNKIEKSGPNIFHERPDITKKDFLNLLYEVFKLFFTDRGNNSINI